MDPTRDKFDHNVNQYFQSLRTRVLRTIFVTWQLFPTLNSGYHRPWYKNSCIMADDDLSSGSKLVATRMLVVIENIHRFVMVTPVGMFHIKKI